MVSSGLRPIHAHGMLRLVDFGPATAPPARRGVFVRAKRVAKPRGVLTAQARRRDREAVVFAFAALVVAVYLAVAAVVHAGPFQSTPAITKSIAVIVAPGDTLDSLSRSYEPASVTLDQRLDQIRELNPRLDISAPLQPGARVVLPVASPGSK